jgi:hypothetical protein
MLDALKLRPVILRRGIGLYEVGVNFRRLIVTDDGYVLPLNHVLSADDAMDLYEHGRYPDVEHPTEAEEEER